MAEDPDEDHELLELLRDHFVPATSYSDATTKLTSEQVFAMVERYSPGRFAAFMIQPAMVKLEYRTQLVGDDILWLMKGRV